MKFKFFRGLLFALAVGIFLTWALLPAGAEEGKLPSASDKVELAQKVEKRTLTLDESLQRALDNNLSIRQAKLNLANEKLSHEKLKATALQSESKIDLQQAELNWSKAQDTFKKNVQQVQIDIISQYIGLKDLKERVALAKMSVELAKKNLDRVREKIKLGTSGELDELAARISLWNAQIQLNQVRQDLERVAESFSFATGIDNPSQFELITKFERPAFNKSLEECLREALEKRAEIKFIKKEIEIAELKLQQLRAENAPLLDLEKAENDLKLAEVSLAQERQKIKEEVRQKYYQLEMMKEKLKLQADSLEKAKKEFHNAQAQFKSGLITPDQLTDAEINYTQAYLDYQKAVGDCNIAYQELLLSLSEELKLGEKDET